MRQPGTLEGFRETEAAGTAQEQRQGAVPVVGHQKVHLPIAGEVAGDRRDRVDPSRSDAPNRPEGNWGSASGRWTGVDVTRSSRSGPREVAHEDRPGLPDRNVCGVVSLKKPWPTPGTDRDAVRRAVAHQEVGLVPSPLTS